MWRWVVVGSALVLTAWALHDQLPFCDPDTTTNDLVIVSTLDGKLTAFAAESGVKAWDLQTEPLLSSNLHHVELTSSGKWVRLVPSLSGGLYRLSGDTLEPLPLTAEQLLSSSFKYSDDLVVAGARQAAWAGVEASSGRVLYRCGAAGCAGGEAATGGLLVLKHTAHTVRALDPRSGLEKWNLSVAEHQLSSRDESACSTTPETDLSVSLVLPDGVVAVARHNERLWQHQLGAPVADAWVLSGGRLKRVDVVGAAAAAAAALYIGVHNQQIYVLEGQSYTSRSSTALAPLPWRPRPATPLLAPGSDTALQQLSDADRGALALLTLYGKTTQSLGNHGYFLAAAACDTGPSEAESGAGEVGAGGSGAGEGHGGSETHHHVHVHVYSLWFWWKEVLLIAISSALLMNLMIWPRFFAPLLRPVSPPLPVGQQEYVIVERHYDVPPPPPAPLEYVSRYATDFTARRCLGRGGFGVVFECVNNIDHCSYAVKRITLPKRESKRERVLREVRALAKLDHENIVRYFNAWVEEPPPAWQQARDAQWARELEGVSVSMTEEHEKVTIDTPTQTHPTSRSIQTKDKDSVMLNLQRPQWEQSLDLQLEKSDHTSKRHRSLSCNDSFSIVFSENAEHTHDGQSQSVSRSHHSKVVTEDDSYIVFANSEDVNHNSQADGPSVNKQLEKVKDCDRTVSKAAGAKKKSHRRHWSLDLCVRSSDNTSSVADSKMYLYIQMQLCRRDSLHAWLRQNRSVGGRKSQVINLFSQIVSAVEYVHLAGLIHRDLKPSNIFFAPDGRVKVGDFGLVTTMGDSSGDGDSCEFEPQMRHTHKVGTHLYMSPEQLRGDRYDFKVDIYSLGLILFELLHPFDTESERVACLLRLREGRFPDSFRDQLPHETNLLELMLSKDPGSRPTAAGVRCRAPLGQQPGQTCHFEMPELSQRA